MLGDELNARLMRKLGASRREFFETIDRPALLPLPPEPYAYAEWRRCRVAPDYHVEVHGHFYSVPSRLIREVVEARITDTTIEVFHRRPARRRPSTVGTAAAAHDDTRAHAERASALRQLDAGADAVLCRRRSGRARRPWSRRSCAPSRTPSRASGPAWASCSWPRPTARSGSKRPASAG